MEPFQFENPRQRKVYDGLLQLGEGPANFYLDVCKLRQRKDELDSVTHLISHLVREIESSIRAVLMPIVEPSDYRNKNDDEQKKQIQAILKTLGIENDQEISKIWLRMAGKENEFALHNRSHRDGLLKPRPFDEEFKNWLDDVERLFFIILERWVERYFSVHEVLNRLIKKTNPTRKDAKYLKNKIPNNAITLRHFFDNCHANWLKPLQNEGFFKYPTSPLHDSSDNTVGSPVWPQSRYLVRMATHNPETVFTIISTLIGTENTRIHEDLTDAANALPPKLASRWAEQEANWIKKQSHLYLSLPHKLGNLSVQLAKNEFVETSFKLMKAILEVCPENRLKINEINSTFGLSSQVASRLESWHYKEIIKLHIPELSRTVGITVFYLICDILQDAVCILKNETIQITPEDWSWIWRPAVEDHSNNYPEKFEDALVRSVRDSAVQMMAAGQTDIRTLVAKLEARPYRMFHRIALHLLRRHAGPAPDLVAERLTNHDLFSAAWCWHEYTLLLGEQFDKLEHHNQETILSWIEQGPGLDEFKRQKETSGRTISEEDFAKRKKSWQLKHLARIGDKLAGKWKNYYDRLMTEVGAPKHPDFLTYSESYFGSTSPKNVEELRAMTVPEVANFLAQWQPLKDFFNTPTPDGLGRVLSDVVAAKPDAFAAEAKCFQGLDPTYVRYLLQGLKEAINKKKHFSWIELLQLCGWVLNQQREIPGRALEKYEADPDWGWARGAIVDLLFEGLDLSWDYLPFELREEIWKILHQLSDDPEPTPEYETQYGGDNMGLETLALNTVRGKAIMAVIRYTLWVRRNLENQPDGKSLLSKGFDEIPEARGVLEAHLDESMDPSLAIRSVFGRWFYWLDLVDAKWAEGHVQMIFPSAETKRQYWEAAWEAYLDFCSPNDKMLGVLNKQYKTAVERIGGWPKRRRRMADPDERLAEHLISYYWRDKITKDKPGGLLPMFWNKAPGNIRGHVITFIGRCLNQKNRQINKDVLSRFQELWADRLAVAKATASSEDHSAEMAAFAW